MPYLDTLPVEQLKDYSIISIIEYFIADIAEIITDAESHAQNIHRVNTQLRQLDAVKRDQSLLRTLDQIEAWHQKTIEITDCCERGLALIYLGRIRYAFSFLKEVKDNYVKVLTQGDFTIAELLKLIQKINAFLYGYNRMPCNFGSSIDEAYSKISGPLAPIIRSNAAFADLRLIQAVELNKNLENIIDTKFSAFMKQFRAAALRAAAFSIDMVGRRKGFVPKEPLETRHEIAKFYSEDRELREAISNFSLTTPDIVPYFSSLRANFTATAAWTLNIDRGLPSGVKRLSYIDQALDKAIFFNPGFCSGAGREYAEQRAQAGFQYVAGSDQRKAAFTKYEDLHDFTVSKKTHHLQRNQGSARVLNEAGDLICINLTPKQSDQRLKNVDGSTKVDAVKLFTFNKKFMARNGSCEFFSFRF